MRNSYKNSGFTLIELLVATAISAIVLTAAFGTIGNVYFTQKRLQGSQDFYSESRFLMERVVQIARNNTIDYDRFFVEVGPGSGSGTGQCGDFFAGTNISKSYSNFNRSDPANSYETVFYWDTNDDNTPDRNLGGAKLDGSPDPCAQAFHKTSSNGVERILSGTEEILYLINGARTLRTAIKREGGQIEVQRELGADTDDDGKADEWGQPDNDCKIDTEVVLGAKILTGDIKDEFCARAHPWTAISPKAIRVTKFTFKPSPDRDPFLNFRVESAQIHPNVFLLIKTKLGNPGKFGFKATEEPQISLQTAASSRIFGNTRQ